MRDAPLLTRVRLRPCPCRVLSRGQCQESEEGDDLYGLGSADGNLPLHSACLKKLADGVVEKLVATYTEGAAVVNGLGTPPAR